jgi:hypothetical protein
MSAREHLTREIWPLLENLYLASADNLAKCDYARSTESGKQLTLNDFVRNQAPKSKRWATIAGNLFSAELDVEREYPPGRPLER